MVATTSRLLHLLSLLQARRDWPGSLLAERLEISGRTVRRDIERLRDMGYRIDATMGPDGGYRLDAGSELPPLLFDDGQIIALTVALQAASVTGVGIEEDALRALTTMRQVMPSRLRYRLDALRFTALPAGPGEASRVSASPDVLIAISAAIRADEILRFDYTRLTHDSDATRTSLRRVEPHRLMTMGGRWYLLGWDLERDDWRVFRVDRLSPRTPSGPRFSPRAFPGGDATEYIAARFKGDDHSNQWPCVGKVILHRPASEVLPFAGDGVVEALGPEQCSLEIGSWSWVALAASMNRFDTDIEVIGPPELAEAFAGLARRNAATAVTWKRAGSNRHERAVAAVRSDS